MYTYICMITRYTCICSSICVCSCICINSYIYRNTCTHIHRSLTVECGALLITRTLLLSPPRFAIYISKLRSTHTRTHTHTHTNTHTQSWFMSHELQVMSHESGVTHTHTHTVLSHEWHTRKHTVITHTHSHTIISHESYTHTHTHTQCWVMTHTHTQTHTVMTHESWVIEERLRPELKLKTDKTHITVNEEAGGAIRSTLKHLSDPCEVVQHP